MSDTAVPLEELDPGTLLAVLIAFRNGDFSMRMPYDQVGLGGKIADTLNEILERESALLGELGQVAQAVGKDGAVTHRINLPRWGGGWSERMDFINALVTDLVRPMNEVARVIGAVARGDLTQAVANGNEDHVLNGEFLRTSREVNGMVAQLRRFASEVSRVAREVGTEGKLGGQADVERVAGTWKDLTDDVNSMASNLTSQVRNIAEVTIAVANGDLSKKITVDVRGEFLELKEAVNTMVDQLRAFASEVTRVAREVGTEGCLGGQAVVQGVGGTWKDLTDSVNSMASNLTSQVRSIAEVTTAVANGDLGKQISVDVQGEILQLKNTINTMVDQLGSFASEVTRVAREVGTEGKLGGQAVVKGVGGVWADLTESVNHMANNLTAQVRNIADVTTAVAMGDLSRKITVEARNEILELKNTINTMVDQLNAFASEVTRVAREVGTEGKLGGQAQVAGAGGVWRDLTDNVNQLAGNLTAQVRAIAEVATAVTAGNLSRSITVTAAGEVAVLKDNINEMIRNLRETTIRSTEQDWLKTNLAKFTRMLQGQRDLLTVANQVLSELAPLVSAHHGVFYLAVGEGEERALQLLATYAFQTRKDLRNVIRLGEGLVGQAALEKTRILITDVPADYVSIESGLGRATPLNLVVLPVVFEGCVNAVVELASFNRFSAVHLAFLEQLTESIGIVLNTIIATMRKEELLTQSQALAEELQAQQEEMTQTNRNLEAQAEALRRSQLQLETQQASLKQALQELEDRARLVSAQKAEVESSRATLQDKAGQQEKDLEERAKLVSRQKAEVEAARSELQDKAEQLAMASKYKSEFLANMSHDLRTPLNSLLILSRALEENAEGNLTPRQVEYSSTIYAAGQDLLELINDVLDLSKIESGTMGVDMAEVSFRALLKFAERTFRPVAEGKNLRFEVHLHPALPPTLHTDSRRLQQIIRNLLSNAFKFTDKGLVALSVAAAREGWSPGHPALDQAPLVLAFAVRDTGIGIDPAKHHVVFEAFQQADGSTSRKYGGTGLGLSISRGIATMLGGEIVLQSIPGKGSTFTLYIPMDGVRDLRAAAPEAECESSSPPPAGEGPLLLLEGPDPFSQQALALNRETFRTAFQRVPSLRERSPHRLLLVEDDPAQLMAVREVLDDPAVETVEALTGREALDALRCGAFDCMVLDLNLPDMTGMDLLRRLKEEWGYLWLPVIIHTARDLTRREEVELRRMAETILIKDPRSPERVFDETALFLDRADAATPRLSDEGCRLMASAARPLQGRRILLVDDDARNIFALRVVLEQEGMHVLPATNGMEALETLEASEDVDLVLMDIMLPGLDGFETMRAMRRRDPLHRLPIIALTAKAMQGDREKCLEAGASDYLPKPVDPGRLLAAMRSHLERA